ncbi:MAG: helix-turn-helix domain-containing protein [Thermoanaerobaculia bacterium]
MSQLAEILLEKLKKIPIGEVGKTADLAGISREQLTRWRRGQLRINPTLTNLERLATVLGLSIAVTDLGRGGVVAEAGSEYPADAVELRRDFEREKKKLRRRIKRLERELGIESGGSSAE